jgi:hypothetical protein
MKIAKIAAMAALLLVSAPAFAQDHTIRVGGELELGGAERASTITTVSGAVGPVVGSLGVKSQFAKGDARASNEFVLGAKYVVPFTYYNVTPYVKGEVGVKSSKGGDTFAALEAGLAGPINESLSWEAGYRYRNYDKAASEGRYALSVIQPLGAFTVDYSLFDYSVSGKNTVAAGVGVATKF